MSETIKMILSLSLSGSILAVLIFVVKPFIMVMLTTADILETYLISMLCTFGYLA